MSGWQPIETAPKDGRVVLCIGHASVFDVEPMKYYAPDPGANNGFCGRWRFGWLDGDGPRIQPTHWMPLPAPPVSA